MKKDYYEVLGASRTADASAIEKPLLHGCVSFHAAAVLCWRYSAVKVRDKCPDVLGERKPGIIAY